MFLPDVRGEFFPFTCLFAHPIRTVLSGHASVQINLERTGEGIIMKKSSVSIAVVFSFFAFLAFGVATPSQAQIGQVEPLAEEVRPFDFTDEYYKENGIDASRLVDRRNGMDGRSVFDQTNDARFRDVRITATMPGYADDGRAIFWNYYAGASKESFSDLAGGDAMALAYAHPMYVFPSSMLRNTDRQSALIRMGDSYFDKNRIGISAVFLVDFTIRTTTRAGHMALKELESRNGRSLDGTPIIRTLAELESLSAQGLVTIRQASPQNSERPSFAVSKVLQYPDRGAIAPDAFLVYIKEADGKPLDSEAHFLSIFECNQGTRACS